MKPQTQTVKHTPTQDTKTSKYVIELGRGERIRQFDVNLEGQIPDLWHIAQAELDLDCRRAILETWHLAHDMRIALAILIEKRDHLNDALQGIVKCIESGQLVRNISKDAEEGWAMKQIGLVRRALAKAQAAIALCEQEKELSVTPANNGGLTIHGIEPYC